MLANKTVNEVEIVAFYTRATYDAVLVLSLFLTIKLMMFFFCFFSYFFVTRETLLQYISEGDDVQAQGSLFVLATLLQTKGIAILAVALYRFFSPFLVLTSYILILVELEESMLDAFGILPQRKQHKKLLLVSFYHYPLFLCIIYFPAKPGQISSAWILLLIPSTGPSTIAWTKKYGQPFFLIQNLIGSYL